MYMNIFYISASNQASIAICLSLKQVEIVYG